ncbi:MAG: tRNA pseudouridine(38-40) synthase TruA [Bacteroidales bacterium]
MAFDGTAYHGWQIQPGAPSIQETVETVLSTLLKIPTRVTGCGRTDTGVHASMYVAHFESPSGVYEALGQNPEQRVFRINRFLPRDIVVYGIKEVPEDLHARFSAIERTYTYWISSRKPLFDRQQVHHVYGRLDLEAMGVCGEILRKTRDFSSFARLHSDTKTNECSLTRVQWTPLEHGYRFDISADRFLRNMVRSIVGTLLEVGMGKSDPDRFEQIVRAKNRSAAGESAPAKGLFLSDVRYAGYAP